MQIFSVSFNFPCNLNMCRLGDFDIILIKPGFKIKYKLYIASGSGPPPQRNFLNAPIAETYVPFFFAVAQHQK